MTGEKCYTIKIVSHQNCAKKGKKTPKTNSKTKPKKSEKEKNEAK